MREDRKSREKRADSGIAVVLEQRAGESVLFLVQLIAAVVLRPHRSISRCTDT